MTPKQRSMLSSQRAVLNLHKNTVSFAQEEIPLKLVNTNSEVKVLRVIVPNTTTIPANTVMSIPVEVDTPPTEDYIIEPYVVNKNILISAALCNGEIGRVNVINDSNFSAKLHRGKCIGQAESVEEIVKKDSKKAMQLRQSKVAVDRTKN